MRALERRLIRLEVARELHAFDPPAICKLALASYESGSPLPENLTRRERNLAEAYLSALVLSEPERWFDRGVPLPLPAVQ